MPRKYCTLLSGDRHTVVYRNLERPCLQLALVVLLLLASLEVPVLLAVLYVQRDLSVLHIPDHLGLHMHRCDPEDLVDLM